MQYKPVIYLVIASLIAVACAAPAAPAQPAASSSSAATAKTESSDAMEKPKTDDAMAKTESGDAMAKPKTDDAMAKTEGDAMGKPKTGGSLRIRNTTDMTDWNMRINGQNSNNVNGIRVAYDSLLKQRETPHPNINYFDKTIEPELAERWEVSADAKTFTFYLQKGVKYANIAPVNGRELTAADAKWSYHYTSSTGDFSDLKASQNGFMWAGLDSITTPDNYTVVVKFKDGFAPFLTYASSAFNPIYPKELLKLEGDFSTNIVGTGPFQHSEADTQKGTRAVFTKNPTYRDADSIYLDDIRYLVLPEDATAFAAFQTRQLDVMNSSSGQGIKDLATQNPEALRQDYPGTPRYVLMNYQFPAFQSQLVRQAVSLAIDRDEFITVMGGGTYGLAGANTFVDIFTQEEVKALQPFDREKAKQLLTEAGYPNGFTFALLTDLGTDQERSLAQLLQAQLKTVGITVEFDVRPRAEVSRDRKKGLFEMHWFGEYGRPDADYSLYGYYYPDQRLNYTSVKDEKLKTYIEAQRREGDPTKRRAIMKEAITYINTEAFGIAIARSPNAFFWHPYVKNYSAHLDQGYPAINAWIDK